MISTPRQPDKYYGIGAVNYQTGETIVHFLRRKLRQEIAELLQALVNKHPTEIVYIAWDNADTYLAIGMDISLLSCEHMPDRHQEFAGDRDLC